MRPDDRGYGPDRRRLLAEVLRRIDGRPGYATVGVGGEIAALGMVVADGDHAGIFEMITHPDHRDRGMAKAILHSLLRWAGSRGAQIAYLQVLDGNEPAERLYRGAGFVPRYQYWYRVRPD